MYSPQQFILDGNTIPNLPVGYSISATSYQNDYGHTKYKYNLSYNNELLAVFKPYSQRSWEALEFNYNKITALGFNFPEDCFARYQVDVLLDDLYYMGNPPNIRFKGGRVFAKTYDAIIKRLQWGYEYHSTKLTVRILKAINEEITKAVIHQYPEAPEGSFEFFRLKQSQLSLQLRQAISFDSFTGELITRWNQIKTSKGDVRIKTGTTAESLGYREEHDTWSTWWLTEDEFLHDGVVVNLADGAAVCPVCGTTVPTGYMVHDEEAGDMCKKCNKQAFEIMNYTTRVPSILKFKAKKVTPETLYLGCELEFETSDRDLARRKVGRALHGHAIMKSDGSIRNGFEVVTCPATLDIHLEIFKSFFDKKITELKKADNVGMHVHVSRKPLSVLTVGKLTEFMNREDNVKFITHIAGRSPNNYCKQQAARTVSFPWLNQSSSERYNALNLNNKDTIEFRIFSTPLTYEEFASKVQFCQALVDYCKPAASSLPLKQHTSHHGFIDWALGNYKFYPDLAAKIKSFSSVSI